MKAESGELFRFRFLTEVRFGVGVRKKLRLYINELKSRKAILLIDENASKSSYVKEAICNIKSSVEVLEIFGPKGEPHISKLEDLRKCVSKFGADLVIGLGGGSTLDMAKGLASVLPNSRPAVDYQGLDKLEKPALPSIMIPTLFGAGAEVTSSAVMINREKKKKGGINGRFVFPKMAVIDPELALNTPFNVLGATSLDALVHSIEGYVSKCSTPLSRMYSRQAAFLLLPALLKLANNPNSVESLEKIAHGSLLAIIGLMHSESGICGAISYPLGVHFNVPHGLSGGLAMPAGIMFNAKNGCTLYSDLLEEKSNHIIAAQKLSDKIKELITAFGLPSLSKFGVEKDNIPKLAEEIFTFKAVLDLNPVKIDSPEIIAQIIESTLSSQ